MDEVELDLISIRNVSEEYEVINKYTSKNVTNKWINTAIYNSSVKYNMELFIT